MQGSQSSLPKKDGIKIFVPVLQRCKTRLTPLLCSAAKLPQEKFFGGQPIDVNFQADTVRNHKKNRGAYKGLS